jgi:hypothetical protein
VPTAMAVTRFRYSFAAPGGGLPYFDISALLRRTLRFMRYTRWKLRR